MFILDYRNGVKQKANSSDYFFLMVEFKVDQKAAQTAHNLNKMHLAQELLTNIQCRGRSRSFAKETRALKMRNTVAGHLNWQPPVERIIEADPLQPTWDVAEELSISHSLVIWHLKQIRKVKRLDKWVVPHELTANQKKKKNHHFKVSASLILCSNNEPFLNWIMTCDKKWILCDNWQQPTQWLDREEAPKHFPKPNLDPKKDHSHWWPTAGLIQYGFLNPNETITSEKYAQQINEMNQKLQCLQLALVNRKVPLLLHDSTWPHVTQPVLQVEWIGLWSFVSSAIFSWPLGSRLPLLQVSW